VGKMTRKMDGTWDIMRLSCIAKVLSGTSSVSIENEALEVPMLGPVAHAITSLILSVSV